MGDGINNGNQTLSYGFLYNEPLPDNFVLSQFLNADGSVHSQLTLNKKENGLRSAVFSLINGAYRVETTPYLTGGVAHSLQLALVQSGLNKQAFITDLGNGVNATSSPTVDSLTTSPQIRSL